MKKATSFFFLLCIVCLFLYNCNEKAANTHDNPDVIDGYSTITENDFTIYLNTRNSNAVMRERISALMKFDLQKIVDLLPAAIVTKLRAKPIWIESSIGAQTIVYHKSNNTNPQKVGCIEIGNMTNYCDKASLNQPFLLMHGFALLYLDQYVTTELKDQLTNTYGMAISSGKYQTVYASNGIKLLQKQPPTAKANKEEYFAELTEAYWGENDFYPFDYEELKRYDNTGFAFMEAIWGNRTIPTNTNNITMPPTTLTQWLSGQESPLDLYYRKYLDAEGLPILASRFVKDESLIQAAYIMKIMLKNVPLAIETMLRYHFRIGIVGYMENITDMPECRLFNTWWPGTDWDARGRGYGATEYVPLMTCGEENIIKIPNYKERYPTESIMVHEFAHNVDFALQRTNRSFSNFVNGTEFKNALEGAYNNALINNLWTDTYSMDNTAEYFAEGAQAWFNTCRMVVKINGINTTLKTREQLRNYDIQLYNLLSRVFPTEYLTGYHFTYE